MNLWHRRQKLKLVVSKMQKCNRLTDYKNSFKDRKWQLIISQIAIFLEPSISVERLFEMETKLIESEKKLFESTLSTIKFSRPNFERVDWKSLENFLRFSYFWNLFKKDRKPNLLYQEENYIQTNAKKRDAFNSWWTSLAKIDNSFNKYVLFINQLVS